jgi:RNA polymerase sigma-70 factor (ECF subfamily)
MGKLGDHRAMNPDENEDFETTWFLVESAKTGDRRALEDLFARYLPRVRRIVALRMGCPIAKFAEFDDIVQNTLLKAFKGFSKFEQRSVGSFRNWLASCAISAIRDFLRKKHPVRPFSEIPGRGGDGGEEEISSYILPPGKEPSPSKHAMGHELERQIEDALLSMDERYREVIIQRNLCGMTDAEIARELGFQEEATVRVVSHRALRKLEKILKSGAN